MALKSFYQGRGKMDNLERQWQYEEKMEQIAGELEELVLNAFIAVLQNLRENTELLRQNANLPQDDEKF